jgi:hypothetical protein
VIWVDMPTSPNPLFFNFVAQSTLELCIYGHPAPGTGAWNVRICPVTALVTSGMFSMPRVKSQVHAKPQRSREDIP